MKKYKIGMYGGKFLPFHKGHKYCLEYAATECEKVYAILFYGGDDEIIAVKGRSEEWLSVEDRKNKLIEISNRFENVVPAFIDVTDCKLPDGSEDWDAETPLVRNLLGNKLDAVYSSEPQYGKYFSRAYPEAEHRLVDVKRIHYPISATMIRNMKDMEEIEKWKI